MDQMNVSITDHLAGYVRRKVKSGRYNSVSEVVRDALRRMEDEEAREIRLAHPTVQDIVGNLTEQQHDSIKQRVRAGIESVKSGEYVDYLGSDGLQELAAGVKKRGRARLAPSSESRK